MSIPKALDLNSNLNDVANALTECEKRIASLKAQLQEEDQLEKRLSAILCQRFAVIFPQSRDAPDFDGKTILRKIDADVKRSVVRVVADEKRLGRTPEEARKTAVIKARFVADKNGLNDLTEGMTKHLEETVEKVYGLKKTAIKTNPRTR